MWVTGNAWIRNQEFNIYSWASLFIIWVFVLHYIKAHNCGEYTILQSLQRTL